MRHYQKYEIRDAVLRRDAQALHEAIDGLSPLDRGMDDIRRTVEEAGGERLIDSRGSVRLDDPCDGTAEVREVFGRGYSSHSSF